MGEALGRGDSAAKWIDFHATIKKAPAGRGLLGEVGGAYQLMAAGMPS